MSKNMEYTLGELLKYEQPTKYIVESSNYNVSYSVPVLTAGKTFVLGYTNETIGVFDKLPVIIFDDFTTETKFVDFKFKVKSSAMKILHINTSLVLPKYIYYRMQIIQFDHSTHKRYWIQHYSKIKIGVPSISEQERIVEYIETMMSKLEDGIETLKKTQQQLTVYRQAVLKKVLIFDERKAIKDCIEEIGQGWSPKCENAPVLNETEWAVITTTAIQPMSFVFSENKKLPDNLMPRKKHLIEVGDILITRAGPRKRCGICCLVRKTKNNLLNCDKAYRLRVKQNVILPEYLESVLNSPDFLREIELCKTGGNDSGVNLTQDRFLNIRIPVPVITEQKKALEMISERLSICDNLEQCVDSSLQQTEALRQSILKHAFEGEENG